VREHRERENTGREREREHRERENTGGEREKREREKALVRQFMMLWPQHTGNRQKHQKGFTKERRGEHKINGRNLRGGQKIDHRIRQEPNQTSDDGRIDAHNIGHSIPSER